MKMMMCAELSAEDAMCAASVATLQMVRKIANGRNGDHGGRSLRSMRERWADVIHGLMGEIALARTLNLPWTPGGMFVSCGDVANKLEVRATEYQSGHLLIYDSDPVESPFVLMIGHYPQFAIAGGIVGKNARCEEWWRPDADPPCWWVPQPALTDILEFIR